MSSWNKNVEVGDRCVLELPMMAAKAQRDLLDKIFRVANDMKNSLIGWYKKQLTEMIRTRRWRETQCGLADLHKEYDSDLAKLEKLDAAIKLEKEHCAKFGTPFKLSRKKAKQRAELAARAKEYKGKERRLIAARNEMIKKYGFSKNDFEKRMGIYRSSYTALVGSAVAQRIADNVWSMFESYLYSNGKKISFSKFSKFLSVESKSNKANIISGNVLS